MISSQRKLLYVALFAGAILFNYGLLRARPLLAAVHAEDARADAARAEIDRLSGQVDLRAAARLERQLVAVEAALAEERERLAGCEARLANAAQAGELAVQVSALASEVGLVVEQEQALEERRASRSEPATLQEQLRSGARPVRRWTLRGDFAGLWGFLSRLRTLPWQVVVLELDVERGGQLDRYEPPLQITMTVAL